jgi:hypothetical protein
MTGVVLTINDDLGRWSIERLGDVILVKEPSHVAIVAVSPGFEPL